MHTLKDRIDVHYEEPDDQVDDGHLDEGKVHCHSGLQEENFSSLHGRRRLGLVAERDVHGRRVIFAARTDWYFLAISEFSAPVAVLAGNFVYFSFFVVCGEAVDPVKFFLVKFIFGKPVNVDAIENGAKGFVHGGTKGCALVSSLEKIQKFGLSKFVLSYLNIVS